MTGVLGKACRYPRCPGIVTDRKKKYCPDHEQEEQTWESRRTRPKNKFYDSSAWVKLSKYKRGINPMCERCNARPSKEVHHIKRLDDFPELALELDNLEALCKSCHAKESQRESMEKRK